MEFLELLLDPHADLLERLQAIRDGWDTGPQAGRHPLQTGHDFIGVGLDHGTLVRRL